MSRRTQYALVFLLVSLIILLGHRWIADHTGHRPTELVVASPTRVDINRANRDELAQVPGIGPRLADRIVLHREGGGKFQRVDDLEQIVGIGPASLQKLRPWLKVDEEQSETGVPREPDRLIRKPSVPAARTAAGKIDVNRASIEQIQTLPGIGPVLAQRIIETREKQPFQSIDDLRRVPGIGPKRLDAIRPLVAVDP